MYKVDVEYRASTTRNLACPCDRDGDKRRNKDMCLHDETPECDGNRIARTSLLETCRQLNETRSYDRKQGRLRLPRKPVIVRDSGPDESAVVGDEKNIVPFLPY